MAKWKRIGIFKYFNSLPSLLLFKISIRLATQFFVTKNVHTRYDICTKKEDTVRSEERRSRAMDRLQESALYRYRDVGQDWPIRGRRCSVRGMQTKEPSREITFIFSVLNSWTFFSIACYKRLRPDCRLNLWTALAITIETTDLVVHDCARLEKMLKFEITGMSSRTTRQISARSRSINWEFHCRPRFIFVPSRKDRTICRERSN